MKNKLSFSVKRFALSLLFIVFTTISFGQLYFGGGINLIKGFTVKSPYLGLTLIGEKINDNQSIYANFNITLNKKEQDVLATDSNNNSVVIGDLTYRYNTLELGRRNYFTDDIEYGLGFYLAEHVTISYNTVEIQLDKGIDQSSISNNSNLRGNVLSLAIGGNAGAQYAFVRGVLFGDIGFNYTLIGLPSNVLAQNYMQSYFSQLNFTVTLGFKKALNLQY